jgi:hypothetical protein
MLHGLSNNPEAYWGPRTCRTFDAGPESSEGIISIGDQEHLTGVDLGEPRVKQQRQPRSVVTHCSPVPRHKD